MKNKIYYILFVFYAIMVVFILYMNGIFTGETASLTNLLINGGFLLIIGILFVISAVSFSRLNRCTAELTDVADKMKQEYNGAGGKNLWENYQDNRNLFDEPALKEMFRKYLMRMRNHRTRMGYGTVCDIEEYINEDLLDRVVMSHFNSSMAGTLTGLGILGTFLGLSMGLGTFDGNDIYTISDNVGPLLSGMKVAFHTSVYGIFFSLVFTFVYRSIMADAYGKLDEFLMTFRQCVMPVQATEDENSAAMLVYQANMANSMKRMLDLLQGGAMEQTKGVERIVTQVMEHLEYSMGTSFQKLGNTIKAAGQAQMSYADTSRQLTEAAAQLMEANRTLQEAVSKEMEKQDAFAKELEEQKQALAAACKEMTDEVSNQLYAFDKMRGLYEK